MQTREGYLFLAAVFDGCHAPSAVGRSMRDDVKTEFVLDALGMAISKSTSCTRLRCMTQTCGRQFHQPRLRKGPPTRRLAPEHGRRGDAYDNALAEGGFATLETRAARSTHLPRAAITPGSAIFRYIEAFESTRRHHSALGNLSPDRIEKTLNNNSSQNSHRCLAKRCHPNRGNSIPAWRRRPAGPIRG